MAQSTRRLPVLVLLAAVVGGLLFYMTASKPVVDLAAEIQAFRNMSKVKSSMEFTRLSPDSVKQLVYVTASSANHFTESYGLVESLQKYAGSQRLLYYDIGLNTGQADEVKSWCNVEYRKLDLSRYPPHFALLNTYAFKVAIVKEVFEEFKGIFWMDSSIRLLRSIPDALYDAVLQGEGIMLFDRTGHSNFAVADPGMYAFLAADVDRQRTTEQYSNNAILFYRTRAVYTDLFQVWLSCAWQHHCIAPQGSQLNCKFSDPGSRKEYASCHRYDQAALNVLLAERYSHDTSRYTFDKSDWLVVKRASAWEGIMQLSEAKIQLCN